MNIPEIFAYIAIFVLSLLVLFQTALISGAPIGKYAWGGGHSVLPKRLRVGSVISIILYLLFAIFILSKAGVVYVIRNESVQDIGIWVLTAYFFIGVLMNGMSRSVPERSVMTPVAAVLAVCTFILAIN